MEQKIKNIFLCPYLKESSDGAVCEAAVSMVKNNLIKDIEDINIKICTSRHFESCYIYYATLKRKASAYRPQVTSSDILINNRNRAANAL